MRRLLGIFLSVVVVAICNNPHVAKAFVVIQQQYSKVAHPWKSFTKRRWDATTTTSTRDVILQQQQKEQHSSPSSPGQQQASSSSSVDNNDPQSADAPGIQVLSLFEGFVRQTTGDDSYRFGDLTKKTITSLTDKDSVLSRTGQVILGEDSYEFGSITRAKLSELEDALEDWRGLEKDPWNKLFGRAMKDIDPEQRRKLIIALFQIGATALLTWGFIANLMAGLAMAIAWFMTLLRQTASMTEIVTQLPLVPWGPNVTESLWRTFLAKYAAINLFLDPIFFVVKGGGTLVWFRMYNAFVVTLSKRLFPKQKRQRFPWIHKLLCLFLAFLVKNVLLSSLVTTGGMVLGGILVRLLLVTGGT